jgi:hypothetical protein
MKVMPGSRLMKRKDPLRLTLRSRRIRMNLMSGSMLTNRKSLRLTLRSKRIRIKVMSGSRLIQGESLRLTLGPGRIRMKGNVRMNVYTWRVPETNLEV